ncbi:MAG: PmbA/TldA family metallopeptidase, partial [Gaiellaceae bacterium]
MTDPLALAERALAAAAGAGDGAHARVIAERSLFLRFAASRPTQATAIDDVTIELSVLRDGHVGQATTNRADREAIEATAKAARAAAEAAARAGGPGA